MKFNVGDKVVYPNHGVGIVQEIRNLHYGEGPFISLRILSTDSTVMVPVGNSKAVGLRKVISKAKVKKILDRIKTMEIDVPQDWKGRYQENQDKMRSGDLQLVAEVLKNLTYLNSVKTLSYRERKMLDRARVLVVSELSEASGKDTATMEGQIDEAMSEILDAKK